MGNAQASSAPRGGRSNANAPPRAAAAAAAVGTAAADPQIPPWATPAVPREHDIFVSFRSDESGEIIRNVTATFEPLGLTVFNPVLQLRDPSAEEMQRHVARSYVMIAAISPRYFESEWCCIEARAAMEANVPIIPVYDGTMYVYAHGIPTDRNPMFWKIVHPHYHPLAKGGEGEALRNYVFKRNVLPATSDNDQRKATADLIAAVSDRVPALGHKLRQPLSSEIVHIDHWTPQTTDDSEDDVSLLAAAAPPKDEDADPCFELDLRAVNSWDWKDYVQKQGQWMKEDILGKLLSYGQRRTYHGFCSAAHATTSPPGTEFALAVFSCDIDFRTDLSIAEQGIVRRIIDRLKDNLRDELRNENHLTRIVACTGWAGCVELVIKAPSAVFEALHRLRRSAPRGLKLDAAIRLTSLEPVFEVTGPFNAVEPLLSRVMQLESGLGSGENVCALVRLPQFRLVVSQATLQRFFVDSRPTSQMFRPVESWTKQPSPLHGVTESSVHSSGPMEKPPRWQWQPERSGPANPSVFVVGNGETNLGFRTFYANTPKAVNSMLQRLAQNDPDCNSVVLTLAPPYAGIAVSLAAAIKGNTVLTSLKLELDPEGDIDAIVHDSGPLGSALKCNGSVTVIDLMGAEVPLHWHKYCHRNSCLQIPAPQPFTQSDPDREVVDLTKVPWAMAEDDRFLNLTMADMIGSGAMGSVFRVSIDGVQFAAKQSHALSNPVLYGLKYNPQGRQEVLADCMREIHALRRLSGHPNIVGFRGVAYSLIEGDVMPAWILIELLRGTLETRIMENKVDLLSDLIGIVTGLEFIHSRGMMHRDIKPQNILMTADGTVKLGGLGFARAERSGRLTPLGTPAYLAPDAQGTEYDRGRDVYAFGVTAVQMVLREDPEAEHAGRMAQMERAMVAAPDFAFLFRKCCEPRSGDRPSCRGLQVALDGLRADAETAKLARERDILQEVLTTVEAREGLRQPKAPAATAAATGNRRVFVSYVARESDSTFQVLVSALRGRGFEVFVPSIGLALTSVREVQARVAESAVVLAVLSPGYFKSRFCCAEAAAAKDGRITVIPVYDGDKHIQSQVLGWKAEETEESTEALRNYVYRGNVVRAVDTQNQIAAIESVFTAIAERCPHLRPGYVFKD